MNIFKAGCFAGSEGFGVGTIDGDGQSESLHPLDVKNIPHIADGGYGIHFVGSLDSGYGYGSYLDIMVFNGEAYGHGDSTGLNLWELSGSSSIHNP